MTTWLDLLVPQRPRAKRRASRINPKLRVVSVAPGLTRAAARRAALKKSPGDFRAFTYDKESGMATLT